MKNLIFAFVSLAASSSEARIVWLSDSKVPSRVQSEINFEVSKACPRLFATETIIVDRERKVSLSDIDVYSVELRDGFERRYDIVIEMEASKDLSYVRLSDLNIRGQCQ